VLELQPKLLERALEIAGGAAELCEYLGVSEGCLKLWRDASARLPDAVFLAVVDLVLRDDIARASHDRRQRLREAGAGSERFTPEVIRSIRI
jgi:hypothetical protein